MATRLARFIEESGISQAEFARRLNAPPPMVCQWANGSRRPGRDYADEIEKLTGGAIPSSYWKRARKPRRS
jgi:transcriptional regulator with XRE-family HTH domain